MQKSLLHLLELSTIKPMTTYRIPEYPTLKPNTLTVVELFESQGCSSCLQANSNIRTIAEDLKQLNLTYNVTY